MKYFKNLSNGYIESLSTGCGDVSISEEEFNQILYVVLNHNQEDGKSYRLREDLTWEESEWPAAESETAGLSDEGFEG